MEDGAAGVITAATGFLGWNGREILATPSDVINRVFGDETSWSVAVAMHGTFEVEDEALREHNLAALITEWRFQGNQEIGPRELFVENGEIRRRPFSEERYRPMEAFVQAHADYLAALKSYLQERVRG